ncbi:MAG: hypothetical protein IKZ82_05910 [Clostridia bacterium]|nr:hypothetical protein [Clostridia bacterium]
MNKTVAALQRLYKELGNDIADVKGCKTTVDVLNALSVKYNGEGGAKLTAKAIDNIANVAGNIGGGGEPQKFKIDIDPDMSRTVTITPSKEEYEGGELIQMHFSSGEAFDLQDIITINGGEVRFYPHTWTSIPPTQVFNVLIINMPNTDITVSENIAPEIHVEL